MRFVPRLFWSLALIGTAVGVGIGLHATSGITMPRAPRERPDIVLVTIDALRADHVSAYGYDRLTTPAIDNFARHAVRFTDATAQAPYTKASIASLMTGLYPSTHQAVTASVPFPETMTGHVTTTPIQTDVLPSSATTLAEALHAAGYRTLGFTANPFLIADFGFAQGFDVFRFYPGGDFASGDHLVADAVDCASASDRGRPLFAWVHLMEPHSPYTPPPLTDGMFKVSGRAEPIADDVAIPFWLLPGSPRDRRRYLAAYDDKIAAADAAFDTLIREFFSVRRSRDRRGADRRPWRTVSRPWRLGAQLESARRAGAGAAGDWRARRGRAGGPGAGAAHRSFSDDSRARERRGSSERRSHTRRPVARQRRSASRALGDCRIAVRIPR